MWEPIHNLNEMTRDERLAFMSFTSDDMKEQIVTYLLTQIKENETVAKQVEFFKGHNKNLVIQNKSLKKKNRFERYKNNRLRSQVANLLEKLRLRD